MSRKARNIHDLQRRRPIRSPYERVLIVCEGRKTEPNYFYEMVNHLKLNTANVEVDGDSDSSPRSVVAHAKQRFKQDREFDRIYCVFDKDEHSTYQEASASIQQVNPQGIFFGITSVPCFEYWLLLHFVHSTKPYARAGKRSPADCVIDDLKLYLPQYNKGSKRIFSQLLDKTNVAIHHAKQAHQQAEKQGTDNPTTQVYILVEYLQNLKNKPA